MSTIYTATQDGKKITAVCRLEKTRNGFCHVVVLKTADGYELATAKIDYSNRTWETYRFQTALYKAMDAARFYANDEENEKFKSNLMRKFNKLACPAVYA